MLAALIMAAVVTLAANTPIIVHLTAAISSQTANAGDAFQFTVADDVISNGTVVIAKGATGSGHVAAVTPAKVRFMSSKPGSLTLAYDWVTGVDGTKIAVSGNQVSTGNQVNPANDERIVNAATNGAAVSVAGQYVPAGAVAGMFHRGGKAEIAPADAITIYVLSAVNVTANKT
jgi:hypothetical protein